MSRKAKIDTKFESAVTAWEVNKALYEYMKRLTERCGWPVVITKGPWLSRGVKGRRYWRAHLALKLGSPWSPIKRRMVWDDFTPGRKPYWKVAS